MEVIRFVFSEFLKILGAAFLSLLAAKAVASWKVTEEGSLANQLARAKPWLYALVLVLAGLSAWNLGYDIAAEAYYWAGLRHAQNSEPVQAYLNSAQAVTLRPGIPRYWQSLEAAKFDLGQCASVIDDKPALDRLTQGRLEEVDSYRFALCFYLVGRYDEALRITDGMTREDRYYLPTYILRGDVLNAQHKFGEAGQTFRAALNILPTSQAAVEGLAHACFLDGDRRQALTVLTNASRLPFPIDAQKRFEALQGLYGQ